MSFLRDKRGVEYDQKDEMLSPGDRLFHAEGLNCCILSILGFKTEINIDNIKNVFAQSYLPNYSRFRSVVVEKHKWKETEVDLEKHIINVNFDPKMGSTRDEFLEYYMTSLSTKPMDLSKPLWEFHVLNFKTCNANSTVLFRVHHSMGDGISLITLLLANSFQTNNPQALPSFPIKQNKQEVMRNNYSSNYLSRFMKWLLFFMRLLFNTLVDMAYFLATISFLKDTNTPIKGAVGVELHPRRFFHKTINLDDIKTVKAALNMTVNDVILGITQGGLSHYLNRRYASNNKKALDQKKYLPSNIRLRAAVMFSQNIKALAGTMEKKLKVEMNNSIGFALLPLTVDLLDDPIDYIRLAKFQMDRKKLSLESHCSHFLASVLPKLIGYKFASAILYKAFINTTMLFSNVPGPTEEINLFEHPLAYIAPFIYGVPHGMTIHYQSYCKKMIISIAVDTNLIPDPHELCNDIENCLKTILKTT